MESDQSIFFFLQSALLLGTSGGLSPGPLSALVISQTIRFGFKEGVIAGLAPLCTDGPLVLLSAFAFYSLGEMTTTLGVISLAGSIFLLWLAWESFTAGALSLDDAQKQNPASLRKGILTNLLNPNPYMFWLAVGGPLLARAISQGGTTLAVFLVAFFGSLVGTKILIAYLTLRFRSFLVGAGYRWVMRLLGIGLFVYALNFGMDGAKALGYL